MKKEIIALTVSAFALLFCDAQNIVPNPSFEEISECPDMIGEVFLAEPWYLSLESPDLFNVCFEGDPDGLDVPLNARGYQEAIDELGNIGSGEGYVGLATYRAITKIGNEREFLGVPLICSMIPGHTYLVSFYTSRCDNFTVDCATSGIGVRFSTMQHTLANPLNTDNVSHIYAQEIIEDQENWTLVSGSFIADSAYSFMHVGNFFDDASTDTLDCISFGMYYVDMFRVIPEDSTECFDAVMESIKPNFSCYPNPVSDFISISSVTPIVEISVLGSFGTYLNMFPNSRSVQLNLNEFASGIYQIKVVTDDHKIQTKSIIVNH